MNEERKRQLRQAGQKGKQAERLLGNRIFKEAMGQLEEQLLDQFRHSRIEDDDVRRDARVALGVLDNLHAQIAAVALGGEASAKELLKIEQREQRKDEASE